MAKVPTKQIQQQPEEEVSSPYIALIKAVGPYITQIAGYAIPAFTSKSDATKTDPVVAKQIEELQRAVGQNAEAIQLLAEKMKETIEGLVDAAEQSKKQIAGYKAVVFASLGISVLSIAMSIYLLSR